MIYRYQSFESASLAVAELRADGYHATICDDSVASLWGPGAVGGVRVIASDEPIEEGVDLSLPDSPILDAVMAVARFVLHGLWIGLFLFVGFQLVLLFMAYPAQTIVMTFIAAFVLMFAVYIAAGVSDALHSVFSDSMLRSHAAHSPSDSFVQTVALLLIFLSMMYG